VILAWTIEFEERAKRDLSKLDKSIQREIVRYLETRISNSHDPRSFGHALSHNLSGLWRYRVRDYRIVCKLEQDRLIVLVVAIGHRSQVYK
jgi:mRNA interferase RelE/StbE